MLKYGFVLLSFFGPTLLMVFRRPYLAIVALGIPLSLGFSPLWDSKLFIQWSQVGTYVLLGNCVMFWVIETNRIKPVALANVSPALWFFVGVLGLSAFLPYLLHTVELDDFTDAVPINQTVEILINWLGVFILIKMVATLREHVPLQNALMVGTLVPVWISVLTFAAIKMGFGPFLPTFLIGGLYEAAMATEQFRFGAIVGEPGTAAFMCMLFLLLSLVLYFRRHRPLLCLTSAGAAAFMGMQTGTRGFLGMAVIFVACFVTLKIFTSGQGRGKTTGRRINQLVRIGLVALVACYLVYTGKQQGLLIFERTEETMAASKAAQSRSIEVLTDRDPVTAMGVVFRAVPIIGGGALNFGTIGGDNNVGHCVYLAIYAKFGIFGIVFLILLLWSAFRSLVILMRRNVEPDQRTRAMILFSGLIAIAAEELVNSSMNFSARLNMLALFFMLIYCERYLHLHRPRPMHSRHPKVRVSLERMPVPPRLLESAGPPAEGAVSHGAI